MKQTMSIAVSLHTVFLKSIIKLYGGITEHHALEHHSMLRCDSYRTRRESRRPVDCVYSSVGIKGSIRALLSFRTVLCNSFIIF